MIVSGLLKEAFSGLELTYNEYNSYNEVKGEVTKSVNFGYGDQDELNRYIANRLNLENFPLIWYVKPNFNANISNLDKFFVNGKFFLMTSTNPQYYNEERALINYTNILSPLSIKMIRTLEKQRNILITDKNLGFFDETKFGLDVYRNQLNETKTKSSTLMYVDARSVDINLQITQKCIYG